jgi:hypothetical protein
MNQAEELTGTLVLVHPDLPHDPVNKQGKVGMILYADLEKDDIFVTFGKGEQALYASDALLVFKKPQAIYQELLNNNRKMAIADLKALYRVGMLLDSGTGKDAKDAMRLVAENPGVHSYAMQSLQAKLGREVGFSQDQSINAGRGR